DLAFDPNLNGTTGASGDAADQFTLTGVAATGVGDTQTVKDFRLFVQQNNGPWQVLYSAAGNEIFTVPSQAATRQTISVPADANAGRLTNITALRLNTINTYGGIYPALREFEILGDGNAVSGVFTVPSLAATRQAISVPAAANVGRLTNITALRLNTINTYGGIYPALREFDVMGVVTPPVVNPANFNCVEVGANHSSGRLFTKLAGTAFAFDVVALKTDGTVETQFASDADKPVTVELVEGSGATACASRAAVNPAVSQTLTFLKTGQPTDLGRKAASMTVGKAYPNLRCRVTDANQTPSVVACSADNFVVRPTGLTITSSASADLTGLNPSAPPPVVKAGANFTLTAASGAMGYGYAPKLDASKVAAHSGAAQVGALAGVFGNADPDTGTATGAAFTYSEVGYFNLAAHGVYDDTFTLVDSAAGDCASGFADSGGKYACNFGNAGTTGYFGRFIPDHFAITPAAPTAACSSGVTPFTYFGQDGFTTPFSVTAQRGSCTETCTDLTLPACICTTRNYQGVWARLDLNTWTDSSATSGLRFSATGLPVSPLSVLEGPTAPVGSWSNGVGTFTTPPRHRASRPVTPVAPVTATISASPLDEDGTAVPAAVALGNVLLHFGVLRLDNAYGSELLPIRVPVRAMYCNAVSGTNCTDWRTNTLDTCTSFSSIDASLGNYQGALNATNFPLTRWNAAQSRTSPLGTGSGVTPGIGVIVFDRPSPAAAGSVDLTLTVPAWLQGGTGTPWPQNPTSRLRFGSPKAPYIYLRERY
ncbi:MAG: hypothetical protein Q8L93_11555, partial [Rhodocyclaceae bacterium]|nr:hypothetical protein [Rhodocyclaceae bacterium]